MEEKPKLLDINQCPNCGSENRLANEVLQNQIKKGKMDKTTIAFLFTHQSIIARPTGWLSAPCIISYYDVCSECGTVYCFHAQTITAVQGGKISPPSQFSTS